MAIGTLAQKIAKDVIGLRGDNIRERAEAIIETHIRSLDGSNFRTYQGRAMALAVYPNQGHNLTYATLGVVGEAGEFADKVKKIVRGDFGPYPNSLAAATLPDAVKTPLVKELGDVLWYVAALARELGVSLEEVAAQNLKKLESRRDRGTLHGSGDTR